MIKNLVSVMFAGVLAVTASSASAATVNVDLSGATTGGIIDGIGADFGAAFVGQTIVGNSISGNPTAPLTLVAADSITVAAFDPGVSAASNSLLSQHNGFGNAGVLSGLLDMAATSITFTAGFFNGGSFDISFYDAAGNIVSAVNSGVFASGYQVLTFNVGTAFAGFSIDNNNDPAGLRFQNFSYETAAAIPLPATGILLIAGLAGLAGVGRMRRRMA